MELPLMNANPTIATMVKTAAIDADAEKQPNPLLRMGAS
jgi:hypothetical protein